MEQHPSSDRMLDAPFLAFSIDRILSPDFGRRHSKTQVSDKLSLGVRLIEDELQLILNRLKKVEGPQNLSSANPQSPPKSPRPNSPESGSPKSCRRPTGSPPHPDPSLSPPVRFYSGRSVELDCPKFLSQSVSSSHQGPESTYTRSFDGSLTLGYHPSSSCNNLRESSPPYCNPSPPMSPHVFARSLGPSRPKSYNRLSSSVPFDSYNRINLSTSPDTRKVEECNRIRQDFSPSPEARSLGPSRSESYNRIDFSSSPDNRNEEECRPWFLKRSPDSPVPSPPLAKRMRSYPGPIKLQLQLRDAKDSNGRSVSPPDTKPDTTLPFTTVGDTKDSKSGIKLGSGHDCSRQDTDTKDKPDGDQDSKVGIKQLGGHDTFRQEIGRWSVAGNNRECLSSPESKPLLKPSWRRSLDDLRTYDHVAFIKEHHTFERNIKDFRTDTEDGPLVTDPQRSSSSPDKVRDRALPCSSFSHKSRPSSVYKTVVSPSTTIHLASASSVPTSPSSAYKTVLSHSSTVHLASAISVPTSPSSVYKTVVSPSSTVHQISASSVPTSPISVYKTVLSPSSTVQQAPTSTSTSCVSSQSTVAVPNRITSPTSSLDTVKRAESSSPESAIESSKSESGSAIGAKGEPVGDDAWPVWVYCSRYSARPSSGPRSRRQPKQHKSPPSSTNSSDESRRSRTAFSTSQLQRLRQEFEASAYLGEARRASLSEQLALTESQVKIWFQNRRAKVKRATGERNPLAQKLMEQGLYNHSTHKDS